MGVCGSLGNWEIIGDVNIEGVTWLDNVDNFINSN